MRLYPGLLWHMNRNDKIIYLSFDDGPIPGPTEFVLEVLRQYNAKGTFFCVGDNIRKHPDIFQDILKGGHSFGNHTFHHKNGWSCTTSDYLEEVSQGQAAISALDGGKKGNYLFRPPYGKITRSQIRSLKEMQSTIVMWDVLSGDFDSKLPMEKCLEKSIASTTKGSIVVFHDSIKAQQRLQFTLPRYLEHFYKLGYTFLGL